MMENQEINEQIIDLWKEYKNKGHKGTKRWPLLIPELEKDNFILFIGITPGFPKNTKKGKGYWPKNDIPNPEEYFNFSNEINKEKEIQREKDARDQKKPAYYKSYFSPIINIMEEIKKELSNNINWDHLDLFFIRETSQDDLKKLIKYKLKGDKIEIRDEFANKQLDISMKIIKEKMNPQLIVVNNALSSDIIQYKWGDNIEFKENEGFHILKDTKTPIFFSSILSGGRLDKGSRKRLVWHIKRALKWIHNKIK